MPPERIARSPAVGIPSRCSRRLVGHQPTAASSRRFAPTNPVTTLQRGECARPRAKVDNTAVPAIRCSVRSSVHPCGFGSPNAGRPINAGTSWFFIEVSHSFRCLIAMGIKNPATTDLFRLVRRLLNHWAAQRSRPTALNENFEADGEQPEWPGQRSDPAIIPSGVFRHTALGPGRRTLTRAAKLPAVPRRSGWASRQRADRCRRPGVLRPNADPGSPHCRRRSLTQRGLRCREMPRIRPPAVAIPGTTRHRRRPRMCHAVRCPICGQATRSGCGAHVERLRVTYRNSNGAKEIQSTEAALVAAPLNHLH